MEKYYTTCIFSVLLFPDKYITTFLYNKIIFPDINKVTIQMVEYRKRKHFRWTILTHDNNYLNFTLFCNHVKATMYYIMCDYKGVHR